MVPEFIDLLSSFSSESALNVTINLLWNSTLHLNVLEERLWRKDAEEAVIDYQHVLVHLIRYRNYRGVRPINAWTIPGSLMYCLSIYSTIGNTVCFFTINQVFLVFTTLELFRELKK